MALSQKKRRIVFLALYVVFLAALMELAARGFWRARGVPFFTAHRNVHLSFYPRLSAVQRQRAADEEPCLNVLLLGASVLHPNYGDIEHVLRERLVRQTRGCVRIHNLAEPAHTSLDSRYKYEHLRDVPFDLVLVYDGINDLRANNCPNDVFREDYAHFSWYKLLNDYEAKATSRWIIFPYTLEFGFLKAVDRMGFSPYLPTHEPAPESLEWGCEVKTAAPFERNLNAILDLAQRKGEPVVLMTFAFYIPEDYSPARFEARQLDYTSHMFPAELWGRPDCLRKGLDVQNDAVTRMALSHPGTLFVDQARLVPQEGKYFNDVCHLTHEGCERFVENLLPAIAIVRPSVVDERSP